MHSLCSGVHMLGAWIWLLPPILSDKCWIICLDSPPGVPTEGWRRWDSWVRTTINQQYAFQLKSKRITSFSSKPTRWQMRNKFYAVVGKTYALLSDLVAQKKRPPWPSSNEERPVLIGHFEPKPIVIAEGFHFHRCIEALWETITEYVTELRGLAATCEFELF